MKRKIKVEYLKSIDRYNQSSHATVWGPVEGPQFTHLIELEEITRLIPEGGTILDVGSGIGLVPDTLFEMGYSVISVDWPVTGGEASLNRLIERGIEGYFICVGEEPIPINEHSVDIVFAGNIIEHLPHSPKSFLLDLKRVLKPGGAIVVDTKNAVDLKTRLKVLFGISNWPRLEGIFFSDFNVHHHKEYTLQELEEVLVLSGFHEVRGRSFEGFFRKSLKKLGTLRAMGASKKEVSTFGTGFNWFHPYEYLRVVLLGLTALFPGLRSEILAVGKKPEPRPS